MIISYLLTNKNNEIKDYGAVVYPNGFSSYDKLILFDNNDIYKILFYGDDGLIYQKYEKELRKFME